MKSSTKFLVPPTIRPDAIVNSIDELRTWQERLRVFAGGSVKYRAWQIPLSEYVQVRYEKSKALNVRPAGPYTLKALSSAAAIPSGIVEGYVDPQGHFRIYRTLDDAGRPLAGNLDVTYSRYDVLALCVQVDAEAKPDQSPLAAVICTPDDWRLIDSLQAAPNQPVPIIAYACKSKCVVPVRTQCVFDFAGKFTEGTLAPLTTAAERAGHKCADFDKHYVDYVVVPNLSTTRKNKKVLEAGKSLITQVIDVAGFNKLLESNATGQPSAGEPTATEAPPKDAADSSGNG